ncbi:hypothetical protein [Klebsiella michiganensis]|uniref:hypothetical protein n=1 Tax=Klebsiella michiganensis TaxID=1134687 RepID=UPI002596124A|nr:hypothetical protein [Klebsiella michiganensis]MDM4530559.1 hypothetical protein [Klebsiella michiganensis]MDM4541636.1 hypothetical protein [Klebsiella michiganensis]
MARKNVAESPVSEGRKAAPVPTESGTIQVMPVRRFMDGDIFRTPADDPFHVSRLRAAELKGNGLVTIVGEVPDNKMNRAHETKG